MKHTLVNVNGKVYKLKYTINALCELENATRHANLNELMAAMQSGDINAVRAMVWAGLIWNNEELTLKEVGEFIGDIKGLQKFGDAIKGAFKDSTPNVQPKDEGDDTPDPTK